MVLNFDNQDPKLHRADEYLNKKLTFLTADQIRFSPIGVGMEKNDTGTYDPKNGYPHLNELGAKWIRIQSGWFRAESKPSVYDFSWVDEGVDNILAQGCIPWICLCYGNSLYDSNAVPGSRSTSCPPIYTQEARDAWQRFVKAFVEHYKGKVFHYEIWNEPDGKHCWKRGVNGAEYADLVKLTAPLIKAVHPDNKVIAGSMCNMIRLERFYEENDVGITFDDDPGIANFYRDWFNEETAPLVDYITFHCYVPTPERKMTELYKELQDRIDLLNPKVRIIMGETGVHSDFARTGALNSGEWNRDSQVKYLLRRLMTDIAHGAYFTSYFSLMDMCEDMEFAGEARKKVKFGFYGVVGADFDENDLSVGTYSRKPSYTALQCMATTMAEGVERESETVRFCITPNVYWGTPDMDENSFMGSRLTAYTLRRQGGDRMYIYYLAAPLLGFTYDGSTSLMLPQPMKKPAILDMATGRFFRIPEEHIRTFDGKQTLLRVVLRDYPLAVIDLEDTTLPIADL